MLSVLFSAVISERRRANWACFAIGADRRQIVGILVFEAGLTTAIGGVGGVALGVLLMRRAR